MKTALLIIGDEILNGGVQDTNSGFAARQLLNAGLPVSRTLVCADREEDIRSALDFLFREADLVISTGGMGPTLDDVTKKVITEYFDTELVFNKEVYANVQKIMTGRGRELNEFNSSQAMVPAAAEVIQNPVGTAPVFWLKKNNKVLITLPGVPAEMRHILEYILLDKLKAAFNTESNLLQDIYTIGLPESELAVLLKDVDQHIIEENESRSAGERYKLAYLPSWNGVKLQLIGSGHDEGLVKQKLASFKEMIVAAAGQYIYSFTDASLSAAVGAMLRERKATLSTAESCTGGFLAHQVTAISGASDYYMGSIISYSNEVKMKELGVQPDTLAQYGAVSEETLREMLQGCLAKFGTTYALATTGIAGPGGATPGKPVGTVWIGVATAGKVIAKRHQFGPDRQKNIHFSAMYALDMLRKEMTGE